jgi:5-formyltetrahydrofolate cyclo-ligase
MVTKPSLRKQMQNVLSQLTSSDLKIQSDFLVGQLRDRVDDRDVWSVFFPLSKEPQIQPFVYYLWELGKTVVVPQIFGDELIPVVYTSDAVLYE